MLQGHIKTVGKGFVFIKGSDEVEYFGHKTALTNARFDELREGQAVEFRPDAGVKGPRAEEITVQG